VFKKFFLTKKIFLLQIFVVFVVLACAAAKPKAYVPLAYSAPVLAQSSQVVSRTYNGVHSPLLAAAPLAYSAGYHAAPLAYSAGYAAPLAAAYSAPLASPYAAAYASPYSAFAHPYSAYAPHVSAYSPYVI
jgi:hypothetical protein